MFSHYKKFASLDSLGFWKTLFDDIANLNFPFKTKKTENLIPPFWISTSIIIYRPSTIIYHLPFDLRKNF